MRFYYIYKMGSIQHNFSLKGIQKWIVALSVLFSIVSFSGYATVVLAESPSAPYSEVISQKRLHTLKSIAFEKCFATPYHQNSSKRLSLEKDALQHFNVLQKVKLRDSSQHFVSIQRSAFLKMLHPVLHHSDEDGIS